TFHEYWSTRSGPVELDWLVIACDAPWLWNGLTGTEFTGPIIVEYRCDSVDGGVKFTRTLRNPARPKPPTPEMVARIDAEADAALAAIRRNVESM
ncbi:MAG TPA: SRPBCC family protein, partial [Rhodoblastus sp.]|nr:SRPBCC family protein [Rhodoblastus sp.]